MSATCRPIGVAANAMRSVRSYPRSGLRHRAIRQPLLTRSGYAYGRRNLAAVLQLVPPVRAIRPNIAIVALASDIDQGGQGYFSSALAFVTGMLDATAIAGPIKLPGVAAAWLLRWVTAGTAWALAMTLLRTAGSAAVGLAIRQSVDAVCAMAIVAAPNRPTATAQTNRFLISVSIDKLQTRTSSLIVRQCGILVHGRGEALQQPPEQQTPAAQ
jgi:hypothetical protein